jgi:hypothetical protein
MGDILRLLAELHHSRAARIRVAGGGAGGDAPDAQAFGPGASLRSAPATQASFPIMGYNESRWSSARSLDILMVEVPFPPVTRRARNKNKSEMNRCLPIRLSRPTSHQPSTRLVGVFILPLCRLTLSRHRLHPENPGLSSRKCHGTCTNIPKTDSRPDPLLAISRRWDRRNGRIPAALPPDKTGELKRWHIRLIRSRFPTWTGSPG